MRMHEFDRKEPMKTIEASKGTKENESRNQRIQVSASKGEIVLTSENFVWEIPTSSLAQGLRTSSADN